MLSNRLNQQHLRRFVAGGQGGGGLGGGSSLRRKPVHRFEKTTHWWNHQKLQHSRLAVLFGRGAGASCAAAAAKRF